MLADISNLLLTLQTPAVAAGLGATASELEAQVHEGWHMLLHQVRCWRGGSNC